MPRKGGGREDIGGTTGHGPTQELARAYAEIAALSDADRRHLHELVRGASGVALSDPEVERIAAILWADRGEGLVASLEAGFKLFEAIGEDEERPRRRRRRSIASLSTDERQALLATLLANRHVPPDAPPYDI